MAGNKYYFGSGSGTTSDTNFIRKKIIEALTDCGADVTTVASYDIKINKWNDIENVGVSLYGSSSYQYNYFIRNIEGKEIIWVYRADIVNSNHGGDTRFLHIGDKLLNLTNIGNFSDMFCLPVERFDASDKVHFIKNLFTKDSTSLNHKVDTSDYDLYCADSFLSLGSIYTDGLGKKYIACNTFMAVSYEE